MIQRENLLLGQKPYLDCTEDERAEYAYLHMLPRIAKVVAYRYRVPDRDDIVDAMLVPLTKALRDPTCTTWGILNYRLEKAAIDEANKIKCYERFKCKLRKEMRATMAQRQES